MTVKKYFEVGYVFFNQAFAFENTVLVEYSLWPMHTVEFFFMHI